MGASTRPAAVLQARSPAILVVDDLEDNRLVLEGRLMKLGYRDITMADSGEAALELMRKHRFDLVLLDVMMPGMGGVKALELMRADDPAAMTPVIMLSASSEMDQVVRCIELGAEDYLGKPINTTLLTARVRATLEKKSLNDFAREQLARLADDLATARELQMNMLPGPLDGERDPTHVHAVLVPATEVGGDLCDFFRDGTGSLWFALGDVSGKGAAAALFMARTWSLFRSVVTQGAARASRAAPGEVLSRISDALCDANATSMFTTLVIGRLDEATGALAFSNAGHLPPYVLGEQGVRVLAGGAPQLAAGAWRGTPYETHEATLAPGEGVFVFSDGITEAENAARAHYGEARLAEDLAELRSLPGDQLLAQIMARVRAHCDGHPQSDDLTALILRRRT